MTQIHPYLTFGGNCREAMTYYKDCLGGALTLLTVKDSPIADQMPPEEGQSILHASLTSGALTIMASDLSQSPGAQGNSVSLLLDCGSEAEVRRLFAALSPGGTITCPLGEQFWGATFGALTDKYGVNWLLSYDKAGQAS